MNQAVQPQEKEGPLMIKKKYYDFNDYLINCLLAMNYRD